MFSFREYQEIMEIIKSSGKQSDFPAAATRESFIIMRHDVEFSVDRAYQLGLFEKENNFYSTYFFQISNNSYNLLSKKNLLLVEKLHTMGHTIGLHFHLNGLEGKDAIIREIKNEISIMNSKFSFQINSFSIHRPTSEVLSYNLQIPEIINAYQAEFFSYIEDMEIEKPEIKYISDARHRWNYGLIPDRDTLLSNAKVQILTHPYTWTPTGYDNLHNFRSLYAEKCHEILETFDNECKHFGEIKDEL